MQSQLSCRYRKAQGNEHFDILAPFVTWNANCHTLSDSWMTHQCALNLKGRYLDAAVLDDVPLPADIPETTDLIACELIASFKPTITERVPGGPGIVPIAREKVTSEPQFANLAVRHVSSIGHNAGLHRGQWSPHGANLVVI